MAGAGVLAEASKLPAPWEMLVQYGALGAVVLFLGLFAWSAIQRERKRADDAEARYYALQEKLQDQIVPALARSADVLERLTFLAPELLLTSKRGS